MPSEAVLGKIYPAVKALLAAHGPLTTQLAVKPLGTSVPAIYDDGSVPQAANNTVGWRPYVTVGSGTQVPSAETMGAEGEPIHGWNCTLQVQAFGQVSEPDILSIMSECAKVLYRGRELGLAGYGSSWIEEFVIQPTITTLQGAVLTRQLPAIVRVLCHD